MRTDQQINVRLPADLRAWLNKEREKNRSSLTSEVVRAIQERKERCEQPLAA